MTYQGEADQCPHCHSIYLPFFEGTDDMRPANISVDECVCTDKPNKTVKVWVIVKPLNG